MTEDSDNIQLILLKLDTIMKRQKQFAEEINELSLEVSKLQALKGEEPQTGHLPAPPPYIPLQHENVQATNFIVEEIAEIPKPFGKVREAILVFIASTTSRPNSRRRILTSQTKSVFEEV